MATTTVTYVTAVVCDDCGAELPVSADNKREAHRQAAVVGWTRHPPVEAWYFDPDRNGPMGGWGWWGRADEFPLSDRCPRCTVAWHRRRIEHQNLGSDIVAEELADLVRMV